MIHPRHLSLIFIAKREREKSVALLTDVSVERRRGLEKTHLSLRDSPFPSLFFLYATTKLRSRSHARHKIALRIQLTLHSR
jgi:hypothetical protein